MLISYYYWKDRDIRPYLEAANEGVTWRLFADSGAYSAYTKGHQIDLDDYIRWLHEYADLFDMYCNLDVIKSAEMSHANLVYMQEAGLNPLPVFHAGEPTSHFLDMIEQYDYIALGGMAGVAPMSAQMRRFFAWAFQQAEGKCSFHSFGITHWEILKAYPWATMDSTTWLSSARFGRVPIFREDVGRMSIVSTGDATYHKWLWAKPWFQRWGIDWADMVVRQRQNHRVHAYCGTLSYLMAERWLRERWANYPHHIADPKLDLPLPRLWLANSSTTYFETLRRAAVMIAQEYGVNV